MATPPPPPRYTGAPEDGALAAAKVTTDTGGDPAPRAALTAFPRNPPEAYRRLEAVYREVDRRVAALSPQCNARGICCDFDRVDHVLFATRLEIDYIRDHLPSERYAGETGNVCPLLTDGLCTAREERMVGCRTYFCQEGWEPFGAEVYEWALGAIQGIVRDLELEYGYAPVLPALRALSATSEEG
jgi:hypothetical protein